MQYILYNLQTFFLNLPVRQVGFIFLIFISLSCSEAYRQDQNTENNKIVALEGIPIGNGIAIHPSENELFISGPSTTINPQNDRPFYSIYTLRFESGDWCCNEKFPFSGSHNDYHPVFTNDGTRIYFNSNRPIPGTTQNTEKVNIWRVSYENGNWGEPEYLNDINTENHESYPTVAEDGTLYFNSDRPGGMGSMDIYKAEPLEDGYGEPVLVNALNTPDSENDLVVDPEKRFIILNRYHFDTKEMDLFISYKNENSWTDPSPLTTINQTGKWELTPSLSPDGDYFLYELNGQIMVKPIDSVLTN